MGKERKKEIDLEIRKKLMREIEKSKEHIKNITDILNDSDRKDIISNTYKITDELDVFSSEAELSEAGHSYPLFSNQKSAGSLKLKKVIKEDRNLVENMEDITEACRQLEVALINEDQINPETELQQIRQYITKTRNEFKNRVNILKGV